MRGSLSLFHLLGGSTPVRSGRCAPGARATAALLALALLVGLLRPAAASDDEPAQAAAHARKAAAAIDLGNYAEAAKEYEAAYMAKPDAPTLLSVGQAWQLAGERQKALTAFRSCLRLAPTEAQRSACETRIRELDPAGQPAPTAWAPAATPVPSPPSPALMVAPAPAPRPASWQPEPAPNLVVCPEPKSTESGLSWPAWTVLGAIVITGMVLGFVYLNQNTDLTMPNTTYGTRQF